MSGSKSHAQPLRILWVIAFTLALVSCGESPQSWDKVGASAPGKFLVTQLPPGAKLTHVQDCNIESLNGSPSTPNKVVTIKRGSEITTTGWAADAAAQKAVENLYVAVVEPQGAVMYVAKSGNRSSRDDVAKDRKLPSPTGLGFEARGDTSLIRPGTYHVVVLSELQKTFKMCDSGAKVQVAE